MPASETLTLTLKHGRFLPISLRLLIGAIRTVIVYFLFWTGELGPPTWVLVRDRAGGLRAKIFLGRDVDEVSGTYELMLRDLELLTEEEFLEKWAD